MSVSWDAHASTWRAASTSRAEKLGERHGAPCPSARPAPSRSAPSRRSRAQATPFLVGLGVAGTAMVAKYGLKAVQKLSANPESMQQMQAAAAGFRAVGSKFRVPNLKNMPFMRGAGASGFEPTMTRREAAQILGIRCVRRVICGHARAAPPCHARPTQRRACVRTVKEQTRRRSRRRTERSCSSTTPTAAARRSSRPKSTRRASASMGRTGRLDPPSREDGRATGAAACRTARAIVLNRALSVLCARIRARSP